MALKKFVMAPTHQLLVNLMRAEQIGPKDTFIMSPEDAMIFVFTPIKKVGKPYQLNFYGKTIEIDFSMHSGEYKIKRA